MSRSCETKKLTASRANACRVTQLMHAVSPAKCTRCPCQGAPTRSPVHSYASPPNCPNRRGSASTSCGHVQRVYRACHSIQFIPSSAKNVMTSQHAPSAAVFEASLELGSRFECSAIGENCSDLRLRLTSLLSLSEEGAACVGFGIAVFLIIDVSKSQRIRSPEASCRGTFYKQNDRLHVSQLKIFWSRGQSR
jgi:hypothetical protein